MKLTTHPNRTSSNSNRSCNANAEVMLSSFASLLSSAVTNGVEHPLISSEDPTLSRLLSLDPTINNNNDNAEPLLFPGLALKNVHANKANYRQNNDKHSNHPSSSSSTINAPTSIQNVAAHSLAVPITANQSSVDSIPSHLLQNLTASLKRLIDSRMRSSLAALRHTMKDGIDDSIMKLLLVTLDPIRITTVVTSFTVVAISADGLISQCDNRRQSEETQQRGAPVVEGPKRITLPLILEAIIDAKVLGKMANLTLQAPGTIMGTMHPTNSLLTSVSVTFDTMALLKSMMSQARIIVKKGIREAACISANFKKNAELGGGPGFFLHNLQQPPQNNQGSTTSTPTSTSSSSSRPTSTSAMQEKLLTSYPNHLRQTVEHFLPASESADSVSIEGFPSHLAKTLLSLSKPKSDSSRSSGVGANGSERGSSSEGSDLSKGQPKQGIKHQHLQSNVNASHGIHNNNMNSVSRSLNSGSNGSSNRHHHLHQHASSWIENVPLTSSSIAADNNNNINSNPSGLMNPPPRGRQRLSHSDKYYNNSHNQSTHDNIHWTNIAQHLGSSSQGQHMVGPSSTFATTRTMGLNSTGLPIAYNSNGDVTNRNTNNLINNSNISAQHHQFLQQQQQNFTSYKRQRIGSGSDDSSEREM